MLRRMDTLTTVEEAKEERRNSAYHSFGVHKQNYNPSRVISCTAIPAIKLNGTIGMYSKY